MFLFPEQLPLASSSVWSYLEYERLLRAQERDGEYLDRLQEAKREFQRNKAFRRWVHRRYKPRQPKSTGKGRNRDLTDEEILEAYEEWNYLGRPKH